MDYRRANDEEEDLKFGELQIADYVVFLLAFDTYLRWMKETGHQNGDPVFTRGMLLLHNVEREHLARIGEFLKAGISNQGSIRMLEQALRLPPTAKGASVRALRLRTILSRGGAATAKHVFGTSTRARREVLDAIESSMIDDASEAFSKFSTIVLRDRRLSSWIQRATAAISTGGEPPVVQSNPVHEASKQVGESAVELRDAKITQEASSPASEVHADSQKDQAAVLKHVETKATEAAAQSLAQSGTPDVPPTRSEVIGIATAAVTAITNDPHDHKNIPPAFMNGGLPLDPEQMDAAQTSGKVLVAAGAGAGKSTTLVSRIGYLVDQGGSPSRIMAVSFNKKAATELQEKIQQKIGADRGKSVMCDTMHTVFRKFIIGDRAMGIPAFGTPEEQRMMTENLIAPPQKGRPPPKVKPGDISRTILAIWKECGPEVLATYTGWPLKIFADGPPKAKKAALYINKWAGNDVSLAQAKATARTDKERLAALYYEFYLGLKGDIPGWRPPNGGSKAFGQYMDRYRKGGERLGDMDDMLKIFRDILKRDPKAKAQIQGMYDHILIDEAQDSNTIQHQIYDSLSEQIECDDKKKSIWLVGDDRQAIYQFRGAKPELFQQHWGDGCWKPKMIRTNYRCPPEVVEIANRLVSHNPDRLPVDAQASPHKTRGEASVRMDVTGDNATAAIDTLHDIRKDIDQDPKKNRPEDYAVLARTNKELNDFETACIINEIPYMRRGGNGFLDAPESKAVLGYIDLAGGTDFVKKQKSLVAALMKPDRGLFLGPDDVEKAVMEAIDDVARYERKDEKDIDPNILLTDRGYARKLAEYLKGKYKNQLMAKGPWLWNKIVDGLTGQILDMGRDVHEIRKITVNPDAKTHDLLKAILDNVTGTTTSWDPSLRREVTVTQTLRENISSFLKLSSDDDDDDEETSSEEAAPPELDAEGRPIAPKKEDAPENPGKGLGAVQFLYALSEPNQNDHDLGVLPDTAVGFTKKIERYSQLADGLRINLREWEDAQSKITDPKLRQKKPPAVTLTTVHSVKGLEWPHVTVLMPSGVFPIELRTKPGEEPPSPEEIKEHDVSERNLAYVALTRAGKNLTVISIPNPKTKQQSPYIADAGLAPGENVPKAEAPTPSVKTASDDPEVSEGMWHYAQWPSGYDRRPT